MTRALVYFHQDPWQPAAGWHVRMLEVLDAMVELGWDITIAGPQLGLPSREVGQVTSPHRRLASFERDVGRWLRRRAGGDWTGVVDVPYSERRWFARLATRSRADVALTFGARSAPILAHTRRLVRVIDAIDLVSTNGVAWTQAEERVNKNLPPPRAATPVAVHGWEGQRLDLADWTIALTEAEAAVIAAATERTRVAVAGIAPPRAAYSSALTSNGLFVGADNPFNVEAVRTVLATVRELRRSGLDIVVDVVGDVGRQFAEEPGVRLHGRVADVEVFYRSARLALAPIFDGTGVKTKVLEALAAGVPVVASRHAAVGTPLEERCGGVTVETPEELAPAIRALWSDEATLRRLAREGQQATHARHESARLAGVLQTIASSA